jgi:hypothetical protein
MIQLAHRANRLAAFFFVQRVSGFTPPAAPHFDNETTAWFSERITRAKSYLEFGSGGSTVLAAKLKVPTVSVESDRFYAKAVSKALPPGTSVTFVTPPLGLTKEWGHPLFRASEKGHRYVFAPFALVNGTFPDLILVDGRYRIACALATAREANRRGATAELLLDDYDDRPHYHVLERFLGCPQRVGRSAVFSIGKVEILRDLVDRYCRDSA